MSDHAHSRAASMASKYSKCRDVLPLDDVPLPGMFTQSCLSTDSTTGSGCGTDDPRGRHQVSIHFNKWK